MSTWMIWRAIRKVIASSKARLFQRYGHFMRAVSEPEGTDWHVVMDRLAATAGDGPARLARRERKPYMGVLEDLSMCGNGPLCSFVKEWTCYLQQHGHRVRELAEYPSVLISRNRKGQRYRWFLCVVDGDSLWLPERNVRTIRTHARLARRSRQQCFVVVKFGHPGGVALAAPASLALKRRLLISDIGAIPWNY